MTSPVGTPGCTCDSGPGCGCSGAVCCVVDCALVEKTAAAARMPAQERCRTVCMRIILGGPALRAAEHSTPRPIHLAYREERGDAQLGIRIALGASRRQVRWLVVKEGACGSVAILMTYRVFATSAI